MKSTDRNDESIPSPATSDENACNGIDLAEGLAGIEITEEEARAWHRDLRAARAAS
jgi:hypothetical protein